VANQPRGGGRGATRSDPDRRQTKAERRDEARRQREEIQRRTAARRRNRTIAIVAGGVLVAAVVALIALNAGGNSSTAATSSAPPPVAQSELQGMLTSQPPWPNNTADLSQRLSVMALPGVSDVVNHHHARLWIYVNGQQVPIPADIGLSQTAGSPLHTHDTSGVIHVEADDPSFQGTLGQFFDVWGLRFTETCVGGVCDSGDQTWHVYLDGKPYVGDPTQLQLADQQAIVLAYGTTDQMPNPLPDNFNFGGAPQL
jgi:hypothetical protein